MGNTLFFPASGECSNGSIDLVGEYGNYWSNFREDGGSAWYLWFDSEEVSTVLDFEDSFHYGRSIRGVIG